MEIFDSIEYKKMNLKSVICNVANILPRLNVLITVIGYELTIHHDIIVKRKKAVCMLMVCDVWCWYAHLMLLKGKSGFFQVARMWTNKKYWHLVEKTGTSVKIPTAIGVKIQPHLIFP